MREPEPESGPPPVVAPVRPGETRRSRWGVVAAALLGGVAVAFSVMAVVAPARPPPRAWGPSRFGPGTRPRLERLRDALASGLVSLRAPAGDYAPPLLDPRQDPAALAREATALGVAALAAARRMGSEAPGLAEALRGAKAVLTNRQKGSGGFGAGVKPERSRVVSTVAAGVLGLAWAGDPEDRPRLRSAVGALAADGASGAFPPGWARGVAARAGLAVLEAGEGDVLGGVAFVIQAGTPPERVDCGDPRVSGAFATVALDPAAAPGWPSQVLAACSKPEFLAWDGPKTDLFTWALSAWLAARVPGGDAWFEKALPLLEKAPDEGGVVRGMEYGEPVTRTACALLVLFEGWEKAPPAGG